METAISAANWLVGKLLNKLSDELVAAYVASSDLGPNSEQIKIKMNHMQGLLHVAQERDVKDNPGLRRLLEDLSKKADEAEDMLDELHYFMIQDKLYGTEEAVPEVGDDLRGHAFHGRRAVRHTIGNWLSYFSCSRTRDIDDDYADTIVTNNPPSATELDSGNGSGYAEKLTFDRVAMSNKFKLVMDSIHNLCDPVSDLLSKTPSNSTTVTIKRPPTASTQAQDKLYGRSAIFEETVNALTDGTYHSRTLSVLPFVGPGGIGKTTFTQHLYNDARIEEHFDVRVWVCVSTDFDVSKLTWKILRCVAVTEKEENNTTNETSSLDQLQKSIEERLKSKKFLIVLDDIWKCNSEGDWKNLLAPFTKGETKGNMVLVTTRFPSIVEMVKTNDSVELRGLEPNDFFTLFEACIFGENKPLHYKDDLIDVGRDIARKLKGSPLAANTVGRLLRKKISREYWMGVLEKNEWKNTKNDDDIMPSLKISYDYLPFYLKKSFSYFALFPEDYRFYNLDFMHFLTAIGIVDSSYRNDNNYLEELVDNGFLVKRNDKFGQYYAIHDLLHELSQIVSSHECVNISNLSFRADEIPKSIRHLSITVEYAHDETFGEEMGKLKSMIDIGNLRSLMIFRFYDERISNIFKITFEAIKGLRVLFIPMSTQNSWPKSFSNLTHLQYLKIKSPFGLQMTLPSTLSRFYHLKFLDLGGWRGSAELPKNISHLVNLRHFHSSGILHSNIPEVGKMKCLQELKVFHVKKGRIGFELRQLGKLRELGGELRIYNLESVASKREASGAKLKNKRNLKRLILVWGGENQTINGDVIEGLEPPPDLRMLAIANYGFALGPRWLLHDISMKRLETLHLESISWDTLPPFEQLPNLAELILNNIGGMRVFGPGVGGITERSFMHLKAIQFVNMPELVEWVGEPNSHLFSRLETIRFQNCPALCLFPFLEYSGCFTDLSALFIDDCPKLSQFPPMPHTSAVRIVRVISGQSSYWYDENTCALYGYNIDLAFQNMDKVKIMSIGDLSHISLSDLQKLKSLKRLVVQRCDSMFAELDNNNAVLRSVEDLDLQELCINGESFSKVLKCFPALSKLSISKCSSLDLVPMEDGGGLHHLTMLQHFKSFYCEKLFSRWPMGEVGGVDTIKPFPASLRYLEIWTEKSASINSWALLSNLTSLTDLCLVSAGKLAMDELNPLIAVNIKTLVVIYGFYFNGQNMPLAGDVLAEMVKSKLMHTGAFQLRDLLVDSISAVLVAPISSHLAATLENLCFSNDLWMKSFTEEQEQMFQLLTSLHDLIFHRCMSLRSLPQGLHRLSSLRKLGVYSCPEITSLPKDGLPASLRTLEVYSCSAQLNEQTKKLIGTNPRLFVEVKADSSVLSVFRGFRVHLPICIMKKVAAGATNSQFHSRSSDAMDTSS